MFSSFSSLGMLNAMYVNTHIAIINNSILIPPYIESVIYLTSFHNIACKFREKERALVRTPLIKLVFCLFDYLIYLAPLLNQLIVRSVFCCMYYWSEILINPT